MTAVINLSNASNIVVTGKSGAGKQPRIDVLVEEFGLNQISTGNIFRHYLGLFNSLEYPKTLDEFWSLSPVHVNYTTFPEHVQVKSAQI